MGKKFGFSLLFVCWALASGQPGFAAANVPCAEQSKAGKVRCDVRHGTCDLKLNGVWTAGDLELKAGVYSCKEKTEISSGYGGSIFDSRYPDHQLRPGVRLDHAGAWTPWLNRDSPGGVGDFETLQSFLQAGQVPQSCSTPQKIECRRRGTTQLVGTGTLSNGERITCEPNKGGYCYNNQQPPGVRCGDYEVRFLCL